MVDAEPPDRSPTPRRLVRRRPTRLQLVTLGLVMLLSFGPVVAVAVVLRNDGGPTQNLIEVPPPPADQASVSVNVTGVTAAAGELRARLTLDPPEDLLADGQSTEDLVLQVNDARGPSRYEFAAGEPIRPVDVTVALIGGSVVRYPFDRYSAVLVVELAIDHEDGSERLDFVMPVTSTADEFDSTATREDADPAAASSVAVVGFDVGRKVTTSAYAVWMMVLMWGLAICGVLIVWAVTIWGVELPLWSFAYFVGVLFALPQLRELLPGRPPPGTVLDFVAFYWSIAIVGVSLVACLAIWVQRVHPARLGRADPPTPEGRGGGDLDDR